MPAFDPIAGMWLESNKIAVTYTYLGETYAFRCEECRDLLARAPEAHIVRLAHEPRNSAGHRCPYQRLENGGSVTRPDEGAPGK